VLAGGAVDPHYILASTPDGSGPNALVVYNSGFPIPPWVANDSISEWIGPRADAANGSGVGDFTYEIMFNVWHVSTAAIVGVMASDNASEIWLNGSDTGSGVAYQSGTAFSYDHWTPFSITAGFVSGLNTLDFVVNNAACGGCTNPSGLRVEYSEVPSVPEPAAVFLMGTVLLGLAGAWERRA